MEGLNHTASGNDDAGCSRLRIERLDNRLAIHRSGIHPPILVQNARPDARPFIHPILAPDGLGELTEDEPPHHAWQHGLYIGLNDVNGVGFWTEGRARKGAESDGSFHPTPIEATQAGPDRIEWLVRADWRSPSGEPMLEEIQEWTFLDHISTFTLDLFWTLRACSDTRFGKHAYGGLFLRMPYRPETGGRALSSDGLEDQEAEGRRARWVAVEVPVAGREALPEPLCHIAILDHPANAEHPSPWRVDRELGVAPSRCISGEWRLGAGATSRSRYRLLISCGSVDTVRVDAEYARFAGA